MFKPHCSSACALAIGRLRPLALSVSLAISAGAFPTLGYANESRSFQVQSGTLDQAITAFGQQSGVLVSVSGNVSLNKQTAGLVGEYTPFGGLTELLKGTGLRAIPNHDGSFTIAAPKSAETSSNDIALDPLTIVDDGYTPTRDEQGANAVYDKNQSTSFMGKAEIERYKGSNPADLLGGMAGVYSGDARNSGGLDPNIRGIQGPGKIPVIIDGTEQAITIWRGYNGANNRSYIDPNLLGGIQVYKGPSNERDVNSGTGGAVVASTLEVDDVVDPGETFGAEIKIEGSNNAVSPNTPGLSTGVSYLDIPGFEASAGVNNDPTLLVTPRSGGSSYWNDYAYRLAIATRQDDLDLLAAYAFRKKGNHFSGKNNSEFYSRGSDNLQQNMIPDMANIYKPGDELPNTSSQMESFLLKSKFNLSEKEFVELGFRDTRTEYGEILPSRISWSRAIDSGVPEWPLSVVDTQAYNLKYEFNPDENKWLDFHLNLWATNTKSDTYTAGGYPNEPYERPSYQGQDVSGLDTRLRNTAVRNANEYRRGVTLSNNFSLSDDLDLTVGGSYQREILRTDDEYNDPELNSNFRMLPKEGQREETNANFDFNWRPNSRIEVQAGMKYSSYWTYDDFLQSRVAAGDTSFTNRRNITGRNIYYNYDHTITLEDIQPTIDMYESSRELYESFGLDVDSMIQEAMNTVGSKTSKQVNEVWELVNGKYTRANHPCLTADVEVTECLSGAEIISSEVKTLDKVKKKEADGWVPSISVAFDLTNQTKLYASHSQAYRYPSLFENTVGFSASLPDPDFELRPEHVYNYEIGYIRNLDDLFDADYADIKLSYFYNRTEDVIDRDPRLLFSNLEKQTIEGVELQGRYDNGKFFSNIGVSYNLKNEVCDESASVVLDYSSNSDCVEDGFVGGYLVSMAPPKYTVNWGVGGRFLNNKLEAGSRFTYHHKHEDKFDSNYQDSDSITYFANTPLSWDSVLTVDAYINYKFNKFLSFDFVGTNLTNEYYLDPLSRSAIPAPGRTFKLSLTGRFK